MGFFGALGTLFAYIFNPGEYKDAGAIGERHIYRELKGCFPKGRIFQNVYIKKKDGKYTEIDLVAVSPKGVFVFESKNYSGWIFGNENDSNWTQTLNRRTKTPFFNPIIQNRVHLNSIQYTFPQLPVDRIFSIIVFSNKCTLKDVTVSSQNVHVIQRRDLIKTVKRIMFNHGDVMSDAQLDDVVRVMLESSRPGDEIKNQHLDGLQQLSASCPRCGSELKERTNTKSGDIFWGCGSFPKCKYTTQVIAPK